MGMTVTSHRRAYLITNTCTCTFRRSLRGWNGQWCMYDEKKSVLIVPGVSILYHELLLEYVAHGCPRRKGKRGVCGTRSQASVSFSAAFLLTRDKTYSWQWICAVSLWLLFDFFSLRSSLSLSRQLQSFRRTLTISKLRLTSLTANDATRHKRDPFLCLNL